MSDAALTLHGTVIAYQGVGCLLLGASGTGKSRIAVEALAQGAKLVADDQVQLQILQGMLAGAAVPSLAGVLEMRGFGLIRLNDILTKHILHLVVELVEGEEVRFPLAETREYLGVSLPYLRLPPFPRTSATVLLMYLRAMQEGRVLPPDWRPGS